MSKFRFSSVLGVQHHYVGPQKSVRNRKAMTGAAAVLAPLGFVSAVLLFLAFFPGGSERETFLRLHEDVSFLPKHDNLRPIIGILTQPHDDGREYIAASYVKYAEAAGARVVPLRYWWTEKQLKQTFQGLNGILFPGGGASLDPSNSKIYKAASILFAEAERSNKIGRRFPIWGTCLGWELLATLSSDYSVLTDSGLFVHPSMSSGIQEIDMSSRLFHGLERKLARAVHKKDKLFYFAHENGVTPQTFREKLDQRCWKIAALGQDIVGKFFVSAAESKCRPYFGVQFHPEKNLYEWYTKVNIPHSIPATEISRHFITLLSLELRWSRPGNWKESEAFARDIHQYPVTTNGDAYFYQEYVFKNRTGTAGEATEGEESVVSNMESETSNMEAEDDVAFPQENANSPEQIE